MIAVNKSSDVLDSEDFCNNKIVPILRTSGLFHCPQCNQGFKQRSNAQTHYKSVHLNVKKQCPHCGQYFKKLKSHIQDVHSVKKLTTCNICGKDYQEGRLFKDHMNRTHFLDEDGNPNEKFLATTECDVCGKCVLKTRFERHMRLRHYLPPNFVVECPLCKAHVKFLPWHLQKFHKNINYARTMVKCDKCDLWFHTAEELEKHQSNHEKYLCVDCLIEFESHMRLAKHMYSVHKKVFNVGAKFSKSIGGKLGCPAVTYHIEKSKESEPVLSAPCNGVVEVVQEISNMDDQDLLENLEEESFTVVLDEEGNLQNVILDQEEEITNTTNLQENLGSPNRNVHLPILGMEAKQGVFRSRSNSRNKNESGLEEHFNKKSEIKDYEVEVDGNTNTFQIIIPSDRFHKYKSLLSEKDNLIRFIQENLPSDYTDGRKEIKSNNKEDKLQERLVTSKKYLPKSLIGVDLSPEDEEVIKKAPNVEELCKKDLLKYQIGKKEDVETSSNKYQSCPSRQAHLCPYCRKLLKTRNSLSRHISVIHLNEKKYLCDECKKCFATKADLCKHRKATHEEARNEIVECDICKETFKASYLKRHKYYKHLSSDLPKHCVECGKEFKTREIMLKHVKKVHKRVTGM